MVKNDWFALISLLYLKSIFYQSVVTPTVNKADNSQV